jgi:hypothetical protein
VIVFLNRLANLFRGWVTKFIFGGAENAGPENDGFNGVLVSLNVSVVSPCGSGLGR